MEGQSSHMTSQKTHKSRTTSDGVPGKPRKSPTTKDTEAPATNALISIAEAIAQGIPPSPVKEQWRRTPDSPTYKLFQKIVILKEAGATSEYVAKKLKKSAGYIDNVMWLARKNGWLNDEDEPIDLEAELVLGIERKIVRNIDRALDGEMTNWQTHEMTLKAAAGRGIFKNYDKQEGGVVMTPIVAIKVVMPSIGESDQRVEIPDSMVGGVPAYIEGEVG